MKLGDIVFYITNTINTKEQNATVLKDEKN